MTSEIDVNAPRRTTYKGYVVHQQSNMVRVYDPRFPDDPELYQTGRLSDAKRWITAYRDGRIWAINELRLRR